MTAVRLMTAAWTAASICLCALSLKPVEAFDFSVAIGLFISLALQFLQVVACIITMRRSGRKRVTMLFLALPLGVTLFYFASGQGQLDSWRLRLENTRRIARIPQFEALLDQEKRHPGSLSRNGYTVEVDPGPPKRIAFIEEGGIVDNYTAIVYDPTDLVLQTNEFRDFSMWHDPKLQRVKKLFGGDMMWAENLKGHWYLCGFT